MGNINNEFGDVETLMLAAGEEGWDNKERRRGKRRKSSQESNI